MESAARATIIGSSQQTCWDSYWVVIEEADARGAMIKRDPVGRHLQGQMGQMAMLRPAAIVGAELY